MVSDRGRMFRVNITRSVLENKAAKGRLNPPSTSKTMENVLEHALVE